MSHSETIQALGRRLGGARYCSAWYCHAADGETAGVVGAANLPAITGEPGGVM